MEQSGHPHEIRTTSTSGQWSSTIKPTIFKQTIFRGHHPNVVKCAVRPQDYQGIVRPQDYQGIDNDCRRWDPHASVEQKLALPEIVLKHV